MKLAVKIMADSKPRTILFIAGFVGSYEVWDRHFQALAADFKLVMIDTLGFGQSPKPQIEYSVDDHVTAIHDTLQAYDIASTHIVGHSMGCLLALAFANRYPSKVLRLALLAFPCFETETQARHTVREGSLFNRWLAMDTWMAKAACTAMCWLRPLLMPLAPYLVHDVPAVVAKDALRHNWASYSRTLRNVIFKGNAGAWMQQFAGPVLLIHGTRDVTAPVSNVQRYSSQSNVRLLELDATHGLIFTHSHLIAAELATFFKEGPLAPGT